MLCAWDEWASLFAAAPLVNRSHSAQIFADIQTKSSLTACFRARLSFLAIRDRHVDAVLVVDQVVNGTPSPQRRGNAPIVGVMVLELGLESGGLRLTERSSRTQRPSGSVLRNRVQTAHLVSGPPTADRFA